MAKMIRILASDPLTGFTKAWTVIEHQIGMFVVDDQGFPDMKSVRQVRAGVKRIRPWRR